MVLTSHRYSTTICYQTLPIAKSGLKVRMLQSILISLGLSQFLRNPSNDGIALSTAVVFSFWLRIVFGSCATLLCVSPSLRSFIRRALVHLLRDAEPARERLARSLRFKLEGEGSSVRVATQSANISAEVSPGASSSSFTIT